MPWNSFPNKSKNQGIPHEHSAHEPDSNNHRHYSVRDAVNGLHPEPRRHCFANYQSGRNQSPPSNPGNIGFLVVAPDRGFLGNEEIRDAFAGFSDYYRADLAFIPWHEEPLRYVTPAIEGLERRGAERVAVLPLAAPKFRRLERMNYRLTQVLEHP